MDDNRLRGFSPPPWAALGRRDPNHEQAPWRESKNVEWRVNPSWAEWGSALVNDDLPYLPDRIARNISGWGVLPASDELMQRHMEDISQSLPRDETPRLGPNEVPMVYAERADGGPVEDDSRGLMQRAWDARPWKDQLNKPADYGPLAIALGLLHPRLGGAVRDAGMSRSLMGKGDTPAVLPSSLPLFRSEPGVTHSAGVSVGPSGTYRPETFNQFLASHNMQIRTPNADADRILRAAYDLSVHRPQKSQTPSLSPANVNSRNPEHMKPRLNVIEGGGAPWKPSPEARADGGPVKPQPSFSEPLSGFIDRTVGGMKDYGRSAMTDAGWAPWAKGAGEVAMSVATSPFESVSSASKLATAPADWATGRQVSASPWDILSALPIAALGGARAAGHISRNRDALRRQDALDSLTGARRERGDLSGTDLRIKQLIDEMASRRNMD